MTVPVSDLQKFTAAAAADALRRIKADIDAQLDEAIRRAEMGILTDASLVWPVAAEGVATSATPPPPDSAEVVSAEDAVEDTATDEVAEVVRPPHPLAGRNRQAVRLRDRRVLEILRQLGGSASLRTIHAAFEPYGVGKRQIESNLDRLREANRVRLESNIDPRENKWVLVEPDPAPASGNGHVRGSYSFLVPSRSAL